MKFSLRSMLLFMLALGALPAWAGNLLIPFVAILVVCILMSIRGFGSDSSSDDVNWG